MLKDKRMQRSREALSELAGDACSYTARMGHVRRSRLTGFRTDRPFQDLCADSEVRYIVELEPTSMIDARPKLSPHDRSTASLDASSDA